MRGRLWRLAADAMILAAIVLSTVAYVRVGNVAEDARDQAQLQCERTVYFSPYIGKYLVDKHVFPPKVQADYFALIPKDCD